MPDVLGRFVSWLDRHRWGVLIGWSVHAFLVHLLFLGFTSWDGLGYRGVPVVEIAQHGVLDTSKYTDWAYLGYFPFVELANVPFVKAFGLVGFLVAGLVLFPLCTAAVYRFAGELVGDRRGALFGAIAYAALPMYNAEPFAGYVDYVSCALLAWWLWAVLRLRTHGGIRAVIWVAATSWLFTMSRVQGVYVVVALAVMLCAVLFGERAGWRLRLRDRRRAALAVGGTLLGALPAIGIQIYKLVEYGTPTYPLQLQLFGIKLGHGVPLENYFVYVGLKDGSASEQLRAFVHGWIGHWGWPIGEFYDSRTSGAGLVFCLAAVLLIYFLRRCSRLERALVAACVVLSLLAHDFVHPRWSYTIVIALVAVIGRSMTELADEKPRWFRVATLLLLLHALRPELDMLQAKSGLYMRLGVVQTPLLVHGPGLISPFPDLGASLVIIGEPNRGLVLPFFGRKLTNVVVGTISPTDVGARCSKLIGLVRAYPKLLFIDDSDLTHDCARRCVIPRKGSCSAFILDPQ